MEDKESLSNSSGAKDGTHIHVSDVLRVEPTPEQEARVVRKIDVYILPLMGICYMLQLMDKSTLSYATQLGILKDLKLQGSQYSWTSSIFYFGYLFWSFPSSYLAVRAPLAKYVASTVVLWGLVLMCHAATKDYAGLMTVRFFLGVTEAAVGPGFSLIVGLFYKREEQPARMLIWFTGNAVANILSGIIAHGVGEITTSNIAAWKLLFLILGGVTTFWGIVLVFLLPSSPSEAKFLTPDERALCLQRTIANKTGILDKSEFKTNQMVAGLLDPQAWFLFLAMFTVSVANGGISAFGSILVAAFGFSPLTAVLMQMPSGGIQLGAMILSSILAAYTKIPRTVIMVFMTIVSLVGIVMVYALPSEQKWSRLGGSWITTTYVATTPLQLSLITSNVGGFTKRSTVSGMLFVAYCVGNIAGPQFYSTDQAPRYSKGIRATLAGYGLATFFTFALFLYYIFENKRRDVKYGLPANVSEPVSEPEEQELEVSNKTDRELIDFRYIL
ncbi:major facilitator superfamily domain-containing protein [Trichoderma breve]|uniref:Major facilitator superfamily domain-containing protein n=1 Tax=Trichoderma breve TaxID=2034170 RepID=A0A9W9EAK1_9HYPO|nr:major facilitator superfamily domain-containing protein [Trichoderma breve]KAJ4863156.1 major facilitator superfamily domain-containing protein [Trichoderma breve]